MQRSWSAVVLVAILVAAGFLILCLPSGSKSQLVKPKVKVSESPAPATQAQPTPAVERQAPLLVSIVDTKTNKTITFGELTDRLNAADIVCIGEQHDSEVCHRIQLQVIKALFAQDERLAVGMEMFQKPYQSVIDQYFAGQISEEQFLKDSEYSKRWGFDWQLYRPIVEFCRRNEIPLAALNVPTELVKRVYKVGFDGLTDAEKKQLGPVNFQVKEHKDYWYERLAKLHGNPNATSEQKDRSYAVMTAWDDVMAQSAAAFRQDRKVQRIVVLAGIGHIAGGFGIPDRAAAYAKGKALTVSIQVDGAQPDEEADAALKTDFVVHVQQSK